MVGTVVGMTRGGSPLRARMEKWWGLRSDLRLERWRSSSDARAPAVVALPMADAAADRRAGGLFLGVAAVCECFIMAAGAATV